MNFEIIHTRTGNIKKGLSQISWCKLIFNYCFDAFLNNTTLYLSRQMTYLRFCIVFLGGKCITYIAWEELRKVMLRTQPKAILHSET